MYLIRFLLYLAWLKLVNWYLRAKLFYMMRREEYYHWVSKEKTKRFIQETIIDGRKKKRE